MEGFIGKEMREILFRGKRLDNGKWFYGYYAYKSESQKYFIIAESISSKCDSYFTEFEVDKNTIGQYTELKDKNGTPIFEGDIIMQNYYRDKERDKTVVKLENGGFDPFAIAGWECTPEPENVEVIGNIYEK